MSQRRLPPVFLAYSLHCVDEHSAHADFGFETVECYYLYGGVIDVKGEKPDFFTFVNCYKARKLCRSECKAVCYDALFTPSCPL